MPARAHSGSEDQGTDRFAGIRRKFRNTIDNRIVVLETARRDVSNGHRVTDALKNMAEEAHRISGVAQTLGFVQLGAAAARLEAEILVLRKAGCTACEMQARVDPLTEDLLDRLEDALKD